MNCVAMRSDMHVAYNQHLSELHKEWREPYTAHNNGSAERAGNVLVTGITVGGLCQLLNSEHR